jgi:squalene-hopene/tetraprenyl-beta-curcumene cyclase
VDAAATLEGVMRLLLPLLLLVACGEPVVQDQPGEKGAAKAPAAGAELDRAAVQAAVDRGVQWLRSQAKDGVFFVQMGDKSFPSPPHTALALTPIARNLPQEKRASDPFVQGGQKFMLQMQKDNGRIPGHEAKYDNYYTSATLMALATIGDPATKAHREKMRDFILTLQRQEKDRVQGGFGYNTAKSADLSNTQYAIEALRAAGVAEDDPAMDAARKYLERTQNRSENAENKDAKYKIEGKTVVPGNDGSAPYEPGVSKAGMRRLPDGTYIPRGYGSMTYALLKCYILVGLEADDPRVKATLDWLGENYTWDENPGFESTVRESSREDAAQARYWGLYYYYTTAAKALRLLGKDTIETPDGPKNWRIELANSILERQQKDGSWINDKAKRWNEDDRIIVTGYALIALQEVLGIE